ncbi:hypothetical protein llap_7320 [Limosa lapponica baueri]|uniref:Uncharacterized protein n=1 Tax=Limosa lapponica baueri TaxID=1758121 RepID=A0A2I0U8T0_LIMLA|nr:hypothetical protein llap_7320 [Limosa lapponica baueri]
MIVKLCDIMWVLQMEKKIQQSWYEKDSCIICSPNTQVVVWVASGPECGLLDSSQQDRSMVLGCRERRSGIPGSASSPTRQRPFDVVGHDIPAFTQEKGKPNNTGYVLHRKSRIPMLAYFICPDGLHHFVKDDLSVLKRAIYCHYNIKKCKPPLGFINILDIEDIFSLYC